MSQSQLQNIEMDRYINNSSELKKKYEEAIDACAAAISNIQTMGYVSTEVMEQLSKVADGL